MKEGEDALFGPEAAGAWVGGEEGAVAATGGGFEGYGGVFADAASKKWGVGDEGVVLGGEDKGGNADGGDDVACAGVLVVVLGIAEAEVGGGDGVVELADGADGAEAVGRVESGKEGGFDGIALEKFADEVALVEEIFWFFEGVGAGGEIERGADGGDAAQGGRSGGGEFAGHFEDEIAAHGIAGEENFGDAVALDKVIEYGAVIAAEA